MKALSIDQPNATFVAAGIKDVENRTWTTTYRGKIYIHATLKKEFAWPDAKYLPKNYLKRLMEWKDKEDLTGAPEDLMRYHRLVLWTFRWYGREFNLDDDLGWLRKAMDEYGPALPSAAIVGEVEIRDIVRDSQSDFAIPGRYHWILDNAVLYDKPIWPVMGKQRLFEISL